MPGFFDLSDPQSSLPLLGLLQGLGNASMPSRTPVPFSSVIGQAAQGYMGGQQAAQQQQGAQTDLQMKQLQFNQMKRQNDAWDAYIKGLMPTAAAVGAVERPASPTMAGAPMQSAILSQESGNNSHVPNSINGAVGPGQIMPATFTKFAKSGEQITNPDDNRAVSARILQTYAQQFNGDPARVAVAYFSGPANVAPAGSSTPWLRDVKDGNGKSVSSYVADITKRLQTLPTQQPNQSPAITPEQTAANAGPGGISPELLQALGPEAGARILMGQKHQLTEDELKARGLPPNTLAESDYTGHVDVVNKPVHWTTVPEAEWGQYGLDPKVVPKGTVVSVNDATGQAHIQYAPAGSTTSLTPAAIRQGAWERLTTGKYPASARDRASQQAIENALAELKPPGMSEEDWLYVRNNRILGLKARTAAAGRVATAQALTAVNEGTVNNSINILSNLLPKAASQGRFTDVNEFEQWLGRKQNDPNAANLKNAIDSISNEYARVMTGSTTGAPSSDSARAEAGQRILLGYNQGTMPAVLAQMKQEMAGRTASYANILNQLSGGEYSGPTVPFAGNQSPVAVPPSGQPAAPSGPEKAWPTPPAGAITMLKMNRDKKSFDALFGPGSADRALGVK